MNAKTILEKIETSIKSNGIQKVISGEFSKTISGYGELLAEFKTMEFEEIDILFKEVRKTRPVIGKKLREALENDSKV